MLVAATATLDAGKRSCRAVLLDLAEMLGLPQAVGATGASRDIGHENMVLGRTVLFLQVCIPISKQSE